MNIKSAPLVALIVFLVGLIFLQGANFSPVRAIIIEAEKVEYNLAYPGLLADHPLYFLKSFRDKLTFFLTRDYIKKTQILLTSADKKAHMAMLLSEKSKWHLSSRLLLESEEEFSRIPELLSVSKRQGVSSADSFILTLKLSNEKHRQVIENLLKEAPQGERRNFENGLTINRKIKDNLLKL